MSERDLFIAALQLADPAERCAWLDRACAGDAALRQRIDVLLQAFDKADSLLESPAIAPEPAAGHTGQGEPSPGAGTEPPVEGPGRLVAGRYKLLEQIGEGGMGTVWMAQQTEPVRRPVAVKLIKPGMDSKAVLARFEAERQALALMDHPNIAKVHDAGTTSGEPGGVSPGSPFFVMELVKGVPLTTYCDEHRLTPRQRLELFVPVCHAIQHAHQKGIIHRDLKPSNVLVARYDDKPVPKVIDFGVAKAIGPPLTEQSLHTGFGAVVGTVEYMSPEQAGFNQLDVDTRSDVYSLGVLLYELLAGSPPFSRKELTQAGLLEMLRVIREQEPSKPSTKLSTAEGLPTLAANRGTEPKRLTALVRGELDWIVMKALEKDRNRRYETANGFAMDLQRYLANEPVQACPPSAWYRFRKFARRNRGPVIAASVILLSLVVGVIGTTGGLVWAVREQDAKEQARQDAVASEGKARAAAEEERKAKVSAQQRLAQLEKGNEILGSIFKDLDPRAEEKEGKLLRLLLGERLEGAVKQLEGEAVGDPLAVARLQLTLGASLLGLGYPEKAIDLFTKARTTYTTRLGPDHPDTLASMNNLAAGYRAAGKLDLALPLLEETLKLTKAKLGPDHPSTLISMNSLAVGYRAAGKLDLALPLWEETHQLMKAKLGPDHPNTLRIMANLAMGYRDVGKPALALPLFEETLQLRKAKLGSDHPDTLASMHNLALGYWDVGKPALALPLFEETLKLRKAKLGADHPDTLHSMANLASAYRAAGKLDLALPLFQEAAAGIEKRQFPHEYGRIVELLCDCHEWLKQFDQAETWRRKWLAVVKERSGGESAAYAGALAALGSNLLEQKKFADAELILRDCLTIRVKKGPDEWTTFNTTSLLGGALLGQMNYAEAEPLLLAGYEGMKKRADKIPPPGKILLIKALQRLVQLYEAWGKPEQAAEWRKQLPATPSPKETPPEKME